MSDLIKICKKHGKLSQENIRIRKGKKSGRSWPACFLCMKDRWSNYYNNNKEKVLKTNLLYTQNNKDKIKEIRIRTRTKNKMQNKIKTAKYVRKRVEELSDVYIKQILSRFSNLKFKEIPMELVLLKRTCLEIKRKIWNQKNPK